MGWFERMWGGLVGRQDAAPVDTGPRLVLHRDSSVYNPMTKLGGLGDKGSVGRPSPYHLPLSPTELRTLYCYNGIARRLVDIVADRACRRGWSVPQIGQEDRRLMTWARVCEAMKMARLHGGSALLLVTDDDVPAGFRARPEQWLAQPLDLERVGHLAALQVFDATEARPTRWDTDIRSPGYRGPAEWSISADGFRVTVHASRVVWFRGARRPPSEMRGGGWTGGSMPDDSCLQAIWDEIRRLTETLQGGAVMAQELREAVLKLHDLKAMMTGDDAGAVADRIGAIADGRGLLGVTLVDKEDDFISASNPPTGFSELSSGAWEALAAVTGVPQVILMGSTPGGLSTDGASSWEGFRQLVNTFQEDNRAELERLYTVVYAAADGPTSGEQPEGWELSFASLDEPDAATLADIRLVIAQTDEINMRNKVYGPETVRKYRYGPEGYSFEIGAADAPAAETPQPSPIPDPAPVTSQNAEPASK